MSKKNKQLINNLRRKMFYNNWKAEDLEPINLSTLVDRARNQLEHPERYLPIATDFLFQDFLDALECINRVGKAIPEIRKLQKQKKNNKQNRY